MKNTIDLLAAIGADASLRHASAEDLARRLAGMQASEGLKGAALSGERGFLEQELGQRLMHSTKSPTQAGFEPGEEESPPQPADREVELPG